MDNKIRHCTNAKSVEGVFTLTLRSSCMSSSSLELPGSDDGFDALLSTLLVVILRRLSCWSGAARALPFAAVWEVPFHTIYDVIRTNCCKQVLIIL
jgi:hypothetical protein